MQVFLLLLALVCVPWMLCTKPYLIWKEHQKIVEQGYQGVASHAQSGGETTEDDDEEDGQGHVAGSGANGSGEHHEMDEEHEFDFGEHVIHQIIRAFGFSSVCA